MKISFVNSLYHPFQVGGAEKSVQLLAEGLSRLGHQISVITLHPGSEVIRRIHNQVEVVQIPLSNSYWPYDNHTHHGFFSRTLWHLRNVWNSKTAGVAGRVLDELKPDIAHVNVPMGFSAAVLSEILSRKIPLVQTLRDYTFLCERATMFRSGRTCQKQCLDCGLFTSQYKRLSNRVSAVVSISQYVHDVHLRNGYFTGVPSYVIFNTANANAQSVPRIFDEAGPNPIAFGFLGQIVEPKGLKILLQATQRMKNKNWSLKIGGSGAESYVAELKRRYPDSRIEWLGFVDPRRFFEQIDVMVFSSIWAEPLGRSLIEAYAAGRTSIASCSGGIPEIATFGKTYATYDAEDVDELARQMDEAASNPIKWRDGGFASPEKSHLFSEATVTSKYLDVYRAIEASKNLRFRRNT